MEFFYVVRLDAVIPDREPLEVNRDKLQTMLSQACEGFTRNMGGPEVTGHCVSWFMNPIMNRVPDFRMKTRVLWSYRLMELVRDAPEIAFTGGPIYGTGWKVTLERMPVLGVSGSKFVDDGPKNPVICPLCEGHHWSGDCPHVERPKSARHWLIRKSIFGRWTPLHLVVELVKLGLWYLILRIVVKTLAT